MKKITVGILEFLSTYKFATYELLMFAGVYKHKSHLSTTMARMVKAGHVKVLTKTEDVDNVYFLSKKGAKWVYSTLEIEANYPKDNIEIMPSQMQHHLYCIKKLVQFKRDYEVPWSASYLDSGYKNELGLIKKKTDINGVESDLIIAMRADDRVEYFLYEYENKKSIKQVIEKVELHIKLMGSGAVQKALGFEDEDRGYRVLIEYNADKDRVGRLMSQVRDHKIASKLKHNFLFWHKDEWREYDGTAISLV